MLSCLERLAIIRVHETPQSAARLFSAAAAWRDAAGLQQPAVEEERHERAVTAAQGAWRGHLRRGPGLVGLRSRRARAREHLLEKELFDQLAP